MRPHIVLLGLAVIASADCIAFDARAGTEDNSRDLVVVTLDRQAVEPVAFIRLEPFGLREELVVLDTRLPLVGRVALFESTGVEARSPWCGSSGGMPG